MKIYLDFRDWWIGYYRSSNHHYICPLPTVVIRWKRTIKVKKSDVCMDPGVFTGINYMVQASCLPDKAYFVPNPHPMDNLLKTMDRLSGLGPPSTLYIHPNYKKYLDAIARLDIKKTDNGYGTVTFPIKTRRDSPDAEQL